MRQFLLLCITCCLIPAKMSAQSKMPALDKSSLDISYFPDNYPLLKTQDKIKEPVVARIIYSRPGKNGRIIFGDLIEYGKVWRLGANEATEIEFFQNISINETKLKKGRYTLYAIPATDKWTLILNRQTDVWGAFNYDMQKDVLRVDVPIEKQADIVETFVMYFDKSANGFSLQIFWDDIKVSLPISL